MRVTKPVRRVDYSRSAGVSGVVEQIEPRLMLSASPVYAGRHFLGSPSGQIEHPVKLRSPSRQGASGKAQLSTAALGATSPSAGLTPTQIRGAYGVGNVNFAGIVGDGTGQTIAIVDPYDDPGLVNSTSSSFSSSDLAIFDSYYGLPNPKLTKYGVTDGAGGNILDATVSTTLPTPDPSGGYKNSGSLSDAGETSLDVEWAHVIAPNAAIVLVEGNGFNGIYDAIVAASKVPGVSAVSMSFGGAESGVGSTSTEQQYDDLVFGTPTVTFIASSGDSGAYGSSAPTTVTPSFPATATNVLAVGGTTLNVSGTTYLGESTWGNGTGSGTTGGGGGGTSLYEPTPAYQAGLGYSNRAYPDISMEANPYTGVNIYDSYDFGTGTGWLPSGQMLGGTSLAAPLFAGLVSIADQGRALDSLPPLNSNGATGGVDVHSLLYRLAGNSTTYTGDFHDITTGAAIGDPAIYSPATGFDLATGLGSPIAGSLVFDLSGISSTPAVSQPAITNLYYKADSNSGLIDIWVNAASPGTGTPTYTFVKADAAAFAYSASTGNDVLTFDFSAGSFNSVFASTTYSASATGNNAINFIGTASSDALTVTSSKITASGGINSNGITLSNVHTVSLAGGSGGNDSIVIQSSPTGGYTINADTAPTATPNVSVTLSGANVPVTFAVSQHLAALTIAATDSVTLAAGGGKVIVVAALTDNGTLDLTNNAMVIHNGNEGTITSLISSAFSNGSWTGVGITSAAARNDGNHMHALGIVLNNNGTTGTIDTTFKSQAVGRNDLLIGFTYYGDANLDGVIDGSDYTKIDFGTSTGSTGWLNGDFNYDSAINGTDYTLIDNAFNTQSTQAASKAAEPAASASKLAVDSQSLVVSTTSSRSIGNKSAASATLFSNHAITAPELQIDSILQKSKKVNRLAVQIGLSSTL